MTRAELHAALDALLDAAETPETGDVDAAAFWHFVAGLARGRGIAEEIETDAMRFMVAHGVVLNPADPETFWRAHQFAVLFKVLRRLRAAGDGILPEGFSATAFEAVARNMVRGEREHSLPDLLNLGTAGGPIRPMRRAAQAILVRAVLYRKALDGVSEKEARARLLPSWGHGPTENTGGGFHRTWLDWKASAAALYDIPKERLGDQPAAAARREIDAKTYALDPQQVEELWGWATSYTPDRN